MKKLIFVLLLLPVMCFWGCKDSEPLEKYVSELRCNVYEDVSDTPTLRAYYGFKENPFINDGVPSKRVYKLTFKLNDTNDLATTFIGLEFNGITYKEQFKLDPVTCFNTAIIEIENFNLSEFTVTLSGAENKDITMKSILPLNTINYVTALTGLRNSQNALISNYTDSTGNFDGEITMRIVVKENHPYWYVGLCGKNKNLKALLIDGLTSKVLAIREVF